MDALAVIGCVAATGAAAGAMLVADRRARAGLTVVALILAAALLAGEGWGQLESLRDRPAVLAAIVVAGAAALFALATVLRRRPMLLPLLLVAALPFRIPIEISGEDANLLLPLYAVIGAGALAALLDAFAEGGRRERREPRALVIALAAALVLYAIQAAYSSDIGFATRNVGFFLVPFAAMFVLFTDVEWSPRLLAISLGVLVGEAVVFALIGVGQAVAQEVFWNPALERSNLYHWYFRVNSLFWDPNIYARYLGLVAVLVAAVLAWTRQPRRILALAGIAALLLAGMFFAFSQTSFISLLFGLVVICGLRWSARWTAIAAPLAAVAVVAAVIVLGGTSEEEDSAREITSGRSTLVEGGVELAADRPLYGHGSASFSDAFQKQEGIRVGKATVSHNEPITVAAEQGAVGLAVYAALVLISLWMLVSGLRSIAPGLGAPDDAVGDPLEGGAGAIALARMALLAAFIALLIHTIGYAGYLTDPLSWTLLAIGAVLSPARKA
jgi:hypothetical protein